MLQLRRKHYELSSWFHLILTASLVTGIFLHLQSEGLFKQTGFLRYTYIYGGVVTLSLILQAIVFLGRNVRGLSLPKARCRLVGDSVVVNLELPTEIKLRPGQYFRIWLPRVQLMSSHPFTVSTWSEQRQRNVRFIVEQRRGFTQELASTLGKKQESLNFTAIISGPHGAQICLRSFHYIVMIATGYGVVPMLAFMKRLLCRPHRGFRRMILIWEYFDFNSGNSTFYILFVPAYCLK